HFLRHQFYLIDNLFHNMALHIPRSTTPTVLENDKKAVQTLILKLKTDAEEQFKEGAEKCQRDLKNGDVSEDEVDEFVTKVFENLNKTFLSYSDDLQQSVKAKAPKKPKKEEFNDQQTYRAAMEKYEQEKQQYIEFVGWVGAIISRLMMWLKDLFVSIKEFFRKLWNWIKEAFQNIAQKVKDFFEFVGQRFSTLAAWLFE
ncbi:unnamed protein product, partial [Didymodactylos carnosus]